MRNGTFRAESENVPLATYYNEALMQSYDLLLPHLMKGQIVP